MNYKYIIFLILKITLFRYNNRKLKRYDMIYNSDCFKKKNSSK